MNIPVAPAARRAVLALGWALSATLAFAQTAPETTPPPASLEEKTGGDVVQLEKFTVTTAIGTYQQTTSSMATKLPMDMKEIPSSLSILNATAIKDRNTVSLTDVFTYVTGASQSQNNVNGFSFRGFPNTGSYTQNIQFDGLQGATLQKAGSTAANVDSLEFLKGPNGVLYGQMNPGGLLNMVTKSPKEKAETNVRVTLGSFWGRDSLGDSFTKTLSLDNTGPVFGSKHLFYRVVVDTSSNPSSRPGNFNNGYSLFPSLTYKWSSDTSFTLKGETSRYTRRQDDGVVPIFTNGVAYGDTAVAPWTTAPLGTVYNDLKDRGLDYGDALSAFFKTTLPLGWQLRVQGRSVWHIDQVRELTINNANIYSPTAKFATPTSLLRRQYNNVRNGHRYNFADANMYRAFGPEKFKNTVIVGLGGGAEVFYNSRLAFGPNQTLAPVNQTITLYNPVLDQFDYPPDGTGVTAQNTYQTAFGEYASDQIKLGTRLHVSLGIRHDRQKVNGLDKLRATTTAFAHDTSAYTKQAGAVFDVTSALSVYGSWSQSFKPSTLIAFDINGNSEFPPEAGEQYEGGVKFETADKKFNLTFATYQITRSNVVVASGTNFTAAQLAVLPPEVAARITVGQAISRVDGEQKSTGYELEARWQPFPHWQLQGGIAHSKAIISASLTNPTTIGQDLANAPRDSANFWTRYNFPSGKLKGLGTGLGIIYVGQAWAGDPSTFVYYRLPEWTRVDGSFYYKWKRYDLALNIQNLLNKTYIASAQSAITLNPGEQRKLTFSVSTKF